MARVSLPILLSGTFILAGCELPWTAETQTVPSSPATQPVSAASPTPTQVSAPVVQTAPAPTESTLISGEERQGDGGGDSGGGNDGGGSGGSAGGSGGGGGTGGGGGGSWN
ncbi:hypothetical protein K3740_19925 (plasmid) [Ruegeria conchae]|uniref:hypothetical protein n=1 Tax=Ruegeria conchae TaxID=981384 RepID=UPI0021A32F3C|nr:hypothetical protein [Ruegeria conchae]UWR05541.1 hypothetical protein K3740_19925 [Ruegeria conchae]